MKAFCPLRPSLAIALCAMLAGCGFTPMYSPGLSPQLASIYVEPMPERDGYELRNTLIDLLGSNGVAAGKRYRLTVNLKQTSRGVALRNDAAITRYNDTLDADYTLTDMAGGTITSGAQTSLSAYNVAASSYATLAAQRDSSKRAAMAIAERIRLDLAAYFRQRR
jgi:LPS-assembly lipoprotein